jgi:hypothetical protein
MCIYYTNDFCLVSRVAYPEAIEWQSGVCNLRKFCFLYPPPPHLLVHRILDRETDVRTVTNFYMRALGGGGEEEEEVELEEEEEEVLRIPNGYTCISIVQSKSKVSFLIF